MTSPRFHFTEQHKSAWEDGKGNTKLLMVVGDGYVWLLKKLLLKDPKLAYYKFARIFEGCGSLRKESGVHKWITELEFGSEQWDPSLESYTTPVAARIEISLEKYDGIRRAGGGGEGDPFTPYTKMGAS